DMLHRASESRSNVACPPPHRGVKALRRIRPTGERCRSRSLPKLRRARQNSSFTPGGTPMLELRPNCECCDRDLPPDTTEAMMCSFECTFCRSCATERLAGRCPNCGGELVTRPRRPDGKLASYPASRKRVLKPAGCGA